MGFGRLQQYAHPENLTVFNYNAVRPISSWSESLNGCSSTRWHEDSALLTSESKSAFLGPLRHHDQGSTGQKLKDVKSVHGSSNSAMKLALICVV